MQFLGKPLDDLTAEDLQSLVENEVKEGRDIEYKESLPGNSESEKKKFLGHVSSFANAAGGHLLYGVREKRDAANEQTGLPESFPGVQNANLATEQQRLEEILQAGLSPRIPAVRFRAVPMGAGSSVLVIYVPRSWAGPHMICYQDWCRFYSRNSSGKYLLDVGELRAAFLRSQVTGERVARFHVERLGRIAARETPVRLAEGPVLVLHLIPIASLDPGVRLDLTCVWEDPTLARPIGHSFSGYRWNLDGVVTLRNPAGDGTCDGYTQVYRNGIVEATTTSVFYPGPRRIKRISCEKHPLEAVATYLALYGKLALEPPLVAYVSLMGVRDYKMNPEPDISEPDFQGIDRDVVVGPEVLIEDLSEPLAQALRPCFDAIWNACGYPRSLNYDGQGNWILGT